jgi:hypothetical protein
MTSTFTSGDLEVLRNRTFDEIAVGDHASIERHAPQPPTFSSSLRCRATSTPSTSIRGSPHRRGSMASLRMGCGAPP